jgi:photosystem II stability/assembly factor-like uncharacterized protein
MRARFSPLVLALALIVSTANAQSPTRLDSALLGSVKWRSIGPVNTSGRIDDFAVSRVAGQPDAIYVATASGGVFKSTNGGTSWAPVFDGVNAMMSIGAVAVSRTKPDVVWAGTGEANNRQSSSWGDGIYKSTDAGKTWKMMGLRDTRSIARIVVDYTNADIIWVAAAGHLWGPNVERGVFKSTDGGATWRKVLYVDENTGTTDLVLDPQNPQTIYAATYQRQRTAWGFNGGGPGSAIYRSTDGGANWTKLVNGLPAGDKGRIGLDVFHADGHIVYATIEAGGAGGRGGGRGGRGAGGGGGAPAEGEASQSAGGEGGVFRSTDGGSKWERLTTLNPRPMYYSQIRVDPKDKNRIYLLGSNRGFYISDDGGRNFREPFSNIHSEDHAFWIDPDDPNHVMVGGDGGVSISWDRALTWDFRRNMPIGQFYEVDVDNKVPYTICGGLQDNGVWCVPSAVRNRNGIADRDAWNIGGGDGFHAHVEPGNDNLAWESSQNGNILRVNLTTMEHQSVRPSGPDRPKRGDPGWRWNWDAPMIFSSHSPNVVYMGANVLFRSDDRGSSWKIISPDVSLNVERDTLQMMGARVAQDALSRHDGQSNYGSLTSIGESPLDARTLYTGTDDGQVQVTRDGGATWTNVTMFIPGLPPRTYVSTVLPSKHVAGRVYATFDGHYNDDYKPYVYVSDDYGKTWRSLSAGLPETSINRVREHPKNPRVLVLAHERGVHFSNDGGTTWNSLATNMPTVPSDDAVFQVRDNALVVGTHGRGIWVLDDVAPLETLTADAVKADALLMPLHAARLWSTWSPQAWYGHGEFFAPNPDFDAVVSYYLKEGASGQAQVEISDANGTAIRTLRGPATRGMNRVTWDLRMSPPVENDSAVAGGRGGGGAGGGGGGGRGGAPVGPLVLPGRYRVVVKVPGVATELRGELSVEGDPLTNFSDADRRARQTLLMSVYGLQKSLGEARTASRALAAQMNDIRKDLVAGGDAGAASRADSLAASIALVVGDVDRAFQAANGARGPIEGYSGLSTADQRRQVDWAFEDAAKAVADFNQLVGTEIPALYSQLAKREWPKRLQPLAAIRR